MPGTTTVRSALVVAIGLALVGCSSLLPDIDVVDPFGLDGTAVELSGAAATLDGSSDQVAFSGTIEATFEVEAADIPSWVTDLVNPRRVVDEVGIETLLEVTVPGDQPPSASFTIVGAAVAIEMYAGDELRVEVSASVEGIDVTASRIVDGCETSAGSTTCTYTIGVAEAFVTLVATGAQAVAYGDVAFTAGSYDVVGTFDVTVDPGLPAGTTIDVIMRSFGGQVQF